MTPSTTPVLQPGPMFRQLRVAVVVPAFNEAAKIAATVATIPDYIDDVFVIDDASTDGTGAIAGTARTAAS